MSVITMKDNQDMVTDNKMDRNLALEAVRVTEAAALAASRTVGRGDEKAADAAAVDAMARGVKFPFYYRLCCYW